jgi:hypothetical protein
MKLQSGYYWVKIFEYSDWEMFNYDSNKNEFRNPIYIPNDGKHFYKINERRIKTPNEL